MARSKDTSSSLSPGRKTRRPSRQLLGREEWIAAARDELMAAGIHSVKVGRLARRLHVTRGSFYWHFSSHADLLQELLKSWVQTNTGPFERVLAENSTPQGVKEFLAIIHLWLDEKDYSPTFDMAVRDWARTSSQAAAAVRRADTRRIDILHQVFIDMGVADPEALVRARVTYFHQVGYYALDLREDRKTRQELAPVYAQVLLGASEELINADFAAQSGIKK